MASASDMIKEMSLEELVALQKEVSQLITQKQADQKHKLAEQFKELAEKSGLELGGITWTEEEGEKAPKKSERKKKKYHPKYRNPENPEQTWTGLGMKPRWVRALLEQGKTMDDLLINKD